MKRYIRSAIVNILDEPGETQLKVAWNSTRPDELRALAQTEHVGVLPAVLANPNTPADVVDNLIATLDDSILWDAIQYEHPSPELLTKLSTHKERSVREAVAENKATPADVLAKLAKDKSVFVVRAVALNRSTPDAVLKKLEKYPDAFVRDYAAQTLGR